VPLIVRAPGIAAGAECAAPVVSHDLYPTICELTGAEPPSGVDGMSLAMLLKSPDKSLDRDTLYWHYPHYYVTTTPVSALRHGEWKLLEYFEDGRIELFHLNDDPQESRNLASEQPGRASELRQRLAQWRNAVNAQLPRPTAQAAPGAPRTINR
jgi:arylsulfatase A-like enzyme